MITAGGQVRWVSVGEGALRYVQVTLYETLQALPSKAYDHAMPDV